MAIVVTFMSPGKMSGALTIGRSRVRETLELVDNPTTTGAAQSGEFALVLHTENNPILCARGSDPDASAAIASEVTDAGFAIPANWPTPVALLGGQRLNFKALA